MVSSLADDDGGFSLLRCVMTVAMVISETKNKLSGLKKSSVCVCGFAFWADGMSVGLSVSNRLDEAAAARFTENHTMRDGVEMNSLVYRNEWQGIFLVCKSD